MKIDNLKVTNFKSLKKLDVDLSNLTLLTGVNSTGKSSLIQTILLLKQNQEILKIVSNNKLLENLKVDGIDEIQSQAYEKLIENGRNQSITLNGEYLELGDKQDVLYQEAYDEDIIIELNVREFKYTVHCNSNDLKISIDSEMPLEALINLFSDDFQYIMTDRISPQITYPLSEYNIKKNLIGFKGEYSAHYLSENRHSKLNIIELKHPDSVTYQLMENVSLWLSEVSKGIEISANVYKELQQVNLTYKYTYEDKTTNNYTPLNVGFGITYVLPIIVAILKAKSDDLLIIENPESHLHPVGQSKIAELCAIASANGVQIIVETHSDHFLNGIRIATKKGLLLPKQSQIYYFRKEIGELETKIDKINIEKDGKVDNWPKGFFDEYSNQLDELLW